jgi:hypothetical protein
MHAGEAFPHLSSMIAVRNYCATRGEPSIAPPASGCFAGGFSLGAPHAWNRWIRMDTDGYGNFGKSPKTRALRGLSEITVSICIHLYPPPLAPNRPSTEKAENFSAFSGHDATSRQLGEIFGVSEKTVRNAAEAAEAVDGTPTRPLAGSSCWRCSMHKCRKLRPLSESGSSCYGATTTTTRAP